MFCLFCVVVVVLCVCVYGINMKSFNGLLDIFRNFFQNIHNMHGSLAAYSVYIIA